jgi:hypothetical protein
MGRSSVGRPTASGFKQMTLCHVLVWHLRLQRRLDLIETLADAAQASSGVFQLDKQLVEWCAVANQSRQRLVHVCLPMQQPIVGGRRLCFERIFDFAQARLFAVGGIESGLSGL